jgi:recombination protein RecR
MSKVLPQALTEAIDALKNLPGVGSRTAERYAFYLLKSDQIKSQKISRSIAELKEQVKYCPITNALIDANEEVSELYSDPKRDKQIVAVVAEPFDIVAIEKTASYTGTYHVLGGLISPIDGVNPENLKIEQLKKRLVSDSVNEVILATNASVEGETTAIYLQKELENIVPKISRLARGLPIGLDLEYADQITLTRAFEGRTLL